MTDIRLRKLLRAGRELLEMAIEGMKEVPEAAVKWRNILARDALLVEWQSLPERQLHRWERVQALRSLSRDDFKTQFGKAKTVAAIWGVVAKETHTTAAAIDQSCKRITRLKNNIERLNERLALDRDDFSIKRWQ
jgi:hypothetical protein